MVKIENSYANLFLIKYTFKDVTPLKTRRPISEQQTSNTSSKIPNGNCESSLVVQSPLDRTNLDRFYSAKIYYFS